MESLKESVNPQLDEIVDKIMNNVDVSQTNDALVVFDDPSNVVIEAEWVVETVPSIGEWISDEADNGKDIKSPGVHIDSEEISDVGGSLDDRNKCSSTSPDYSHSEIGSEDITSSESISDGLIITNIKRPFIVARRKKGVHIKEKQRKRKIQDIPVDAFDQQSKDDDNSSISSMADLEVQDDVMDHEALVIDGEERVLNRDIESLNIAGVQAPPPPPISFFSKTMRSGSDGRSISISLGKGFQYCAGAGTDKMMQTSLEGNWYAVQTPYGPKMLDAGKNNSDLKVPAARLDKVGDQSVYGSDMLQSKDVFKVKKRGSKVNRIGPKGRQDAKNKDNVVVRQDSEGVSRLELVDYKSTQSDSEVKDIGVSMDQVIDIMINEENEGTAVVVPEDSNSQTTDVREDYLPNLVDYGDSSTSQSDDTQISCSGHVPTDLSQDVNKDNMVSSSPDRVAQMNTRVDIGTSPINNLSPGTILYEGIEDEKINVDKIAACMVWIRRPKDLDISFLYDAVGVVIGATNIVAAHPSTEERLVIQVRLREHADRLLDRGIVVRGDWMQAYRMAEKAIKVTLCNVPPFVSNQALVKVLSEYGDLRETDIQVVKIFTRKKEFQHIVTFRRTAWIRVTDHPPIPSQLYVRYAGKMYLIDVTSGYMICHKCGGTGHAIQLCKGGEPIVNQAASVSVQGTIQKSRTFAEVVAAGGMNVEGRVVVDIPVASTSGYTGKKVLTGTNLTPLGSRRTGIGNASPGVQGSTIDLNSKYVFSQRDQRTNTVDVSANVFQNQRNCDPSASPTFRLSTISNVNSNPAVRSYNNRNRNRRKNSFLQPTDLYDSVSGDTDSIKSSGLVGTPKRVIDGNVKRTNGRVWSRLESPRIGSEVDNTSALCDVAEKVQLKKRWVVIKPKQPIIDKAITFGSQTPTVKRIVEIDSPVSPNRLHLPLKEGRNKVQENDITEAHEIYNVDDLIEVLNEYIDADQIYSETGYFPTLTCRRISLNRVLDLYHSERRFFDAKDSTCKTSFTMYLVALCKGIAQGKLTEEVMSNDFLGTGLNKVSTDKEGTVPLGDRSQRKRVCARPFDNPGSKDPNANLPVSLKCNFNSISKEDKKQRDAYIDALFDITVDNWQLANRKKQKLKHR